MKVVFKLSAALIFAASYMTISGCKKDAQVPGLKTTAASMITTTTAATGGNVTSTGGAEVTNRGVCWNTAGDPAQTDFKTSDGTGSGTFSSNLTGLLANTTYYVRAYATNSAGTAYGSQINFTTKNETGEIIFNPDLTYGSVSDIDGNIYKTILIGTQTWIAENLKTTKYNNGEVIPLIEDTENWSTLETAGYCWYNNDPVENRDIYGALYNWYSVNSGKLCPSGWHVPDSVAFNTLNDYLGRGTDAGGKLKETGTVHWATPNPGATNESGWTALPAGLRNNIGVFEKLGFEGDWWYSAAALPTTSGELTYLRWYVTGLNFTVDYDIVLIGAAVRCVKDD
jgi:uncharacterized protein (TIGR02145 family)